MRVNTKNMNQVTLIDSEWYLLTCMRYIELNPVRAGMVADPIECPWSSYRFNVLGKLMTNYPSCRISPLGN
jgi:hypothetical protein